MRAFRAALLSLVFCLWTAFGAVAGEVVIENVEVKPSSVGGFDFSVTLRHEDEGWQHYADRWAVESLDGSVMFGERVLFHPHIDEQPFTRSLRAVVIPRGIAQVRIRARDKLHGWSSQTVVVDLPGR